MEATIATVHIIITSLNLHGKRFVQCFVFSKNDISFPNSFSLVVNSQKLTAHFSMGFIELQAVRRLAGTNGFRVGEGLKGEALPGAEWIEVSQA